MDKPLVTHVLWTLGRAGAERAVYELATRLQAQGFCVRVVSAGGGGEMAADFRAAGVDLAIGPETASRRDTIAFLRAEFNSHRPALVHTHLVGGDVWGGWAASRERVRPWVITAHNDDRDEPWLTHFVRGIAYRRADRVICVSEAVRAFLRKEFSVADSRLTVIPNGVDLARLMTREGATFRDIPRLITVGRLVEQKGHETLLLALAPIRRPWQLDIVGQGPKLRVLERLAESLGILPSVRFFGSVRDVEARLAEADLFCFPSLWEGQGLALLEAAGSGVPIIASDLPAFREAFDEQSMTLVHSSSVDEWTVALEAILKDPLSAINRARLAQSIVRERFGIDHMVQKYAELYRSLL